MTLSSAITYRVYSLHMSLFALRRVDNYHALFLGDRSLEGDMLPENLAVLAACNPYRRHRQTGKLVYRVHPLPETMKVRTYVSLLCSQIAPSIPFGSTTLIVLNILLSYAY